MQEDLRLVLVIVGALAIAGLLFHGLWTNRKDKPTKFSEKPLKKFADKSQDNTGFDDDGIGEVRVVSRANSSESNVPPEKKAVSPEKSARKEPGFNFSDDLVTDDPLLNSQSSSAADVTFTGAAQPSFSAEEQEVANQTAMNLNKNENFSSVATSSTNNALTMEFDAQQPQPVNRHPNQELMEFSAVTQESVIDERVDDTVNETADAIVVEQPMAEQPIVTEPEEKEPLVIILNVHASKGMEFNGAQLFNAMEQHSLHLGEMAIYHRHADLVGAGKVLFSVANSVNPGSFITDSVETFTTPGVTFFMSVPCYGNAEQNFKLMLQTAQQLADDMGGLVMDEKRHVISSQKLDEIRHKIKSY
ncbi:cell division protein ZipA [Vibrio sp. SS-MA-C1-2]|uniref:cell division protein ZipA n=1 Tax=Vibrio sp. SS-MA-C1-2 TaxID=2908646 RepID=UPI001F328CA5|nr:cell division protein ZipA [Vibrio sp. SS-MA-C1-2]UJF19801.1 cell division protein ZipA [Vibrio sp. SS-MA-C1-2]